MLAECLAGSEITQLVSGSVALCVRHGSTFKPAVEDLGNSLKHALALLRRDLDVVNVLSVYVGDGALTGEPFKFLDRANADDLFAVIRDPDGDRVTPETCP